MKDAFLFRNKENLREIEEKPGFYKWWASKTEVCKILQELKVDFNEIEKALEEKNNLYCIYVGIAVNESVRDRINWHINDVHSESRVRDGTLSTLRQSISSIVSHNQFDKDNTNIFIDKLKIEYFYNENDIKSEKANEELHAIERGLLAKKLYILNIQENYHPLAKDIKRELKKLRKQSKTKNE